MAVTTGLGPERSTLASWTEGAALQRARVARLATGELLVELLVELGVVERRVVFGRVSVRRGGGGEVVAVLAVAATRRASVARTR